MSSATESRQIALTVPLNIDNAPDETDPMIQWGTMRDSCAASAWSNPGPSD